MQLSYFELIPFLFHSEQASLIRRRTVKGVLQSVSSRAVGQENDLHVMIVLSTLPTPSPPALLVRIFIEASLCSQDCLAHSH